MKIEIALTPAQIRELKYMLTDQIGKHEKAKEKIFDDPDMMQFLNEKIKLIEEIFETLDTAWKF